LIRVERVLDLDSEGQLIASVLSKKVAAGATHVLLDMPIGPTAKVRSAAAAQELTATLLAVAEVFGIKARVVPSEGLQPVGRGIGPALEARDVLAVLQRASHAPADLGARAVSFAGSILELAGAAAEGEGRAMAAAVLDDGRAWAKFQRICEAQGGLRPPPVPAHFHPIVAPRAGTVTAIDNRRLSTVAKLAGAPDAKASGVDVDAKLGDKLEKGAPLYTVNAETPGELAYALDYARANRTIFTLSEV
jgi:thymidine phosphorylase